MTAGREAAPPRSDRPAGEAAAMLDARDWAGTPLGPAADWPPLLRAMVATCLAAPAPMAVSWGEARILLYNDACIPLLGARHPDAFGAAAGAESAPWRLRATPIVDETGRIAGSLHQPAAPGSAIEGALAAAGGLGAWDWDPALDRVAVEPAVARAHGLDPGPAASGVPIAAFARAIHPDDLPRLSAAGGHSLREGAPFVEEYRVLGEGERRILARGGPVRDGTGPAARLRGIAFAVARPGGEPDAASSRRGPARRIPDGTVDDAIVATDLDGRVTRWNDGAERVFGWTEREMVGSTAERLFTAEDRAAGRMRIELARARLGGGDDERWHVRKGGARFWAQGRTTPLRDDAGEVAGYVKVLRDETAQKRQGQRLQLLARASAGLLGAERPDDVLNAVLDASAGLVEFDQSHSFGLTPDGRHLRLLHSSGTGPGTFEAMQFMPFAGVLCGIVAETRRPLVLRDLQASTDPRHAASRAAGLQAYAGYPIRSRDKLFGVLSFGSFRRAAFDAETLSFFRTLAHYVSIVHDRADRDAALRALNATLEQQVEARTTELMSAEAALRQSQKMEAVGQLTGGLAHDFNNLLTGIGGSLEVLGMRVAQGRVQELDRYIDAAQGAARRAASLTHRLLAFSRRQTLDPSPTDANALVAGMAELVRGTVGPAIALELVAAGDLWTTLVDSSQLENALLNLCINARDAMPDGGRLVIETGNRSLDRHAARDRDLPPGEYVTLCVSDDGAGMTAEVAARAFDPFFTTKPIGQGTGLGLSMIYGFARQSGGQVRIHSAPGRGTTVCLYLPRHHGLAGTPEAPAADPGTARASREETVLVVDDEPTVRMLVVEVLEDLGYVAIEAEDGASGLAVMQSGARIDLLVTDVGLPGGINGRQMADAGRAIRPGLRVLFITGYAEHAVLSHGHLEPGMQVMTKPFAMAGLAARIRELIGG